MICSRRRIHERVVRVILVKGLSRDFTLEKYRELCKTLLDCGYSTRTIHDYLMQCESKSELNPAIAILRHDVDRKPYNSLKMAGLENSLGICSTYYFRYPYTFKPEIMRKIRDLGHEVGYHYEVLAKANGDTEKAIHLFEQELVAMREVCDIKTICMHGSPLSRYDNRDLWKHYDFRNFGVESEAYLSFQDVGLQYLHGHRAELEWEAFGAGRDAGLWPDHISSEEDR